MKAAAGEGVEGEKEEEEEEEDDEGADGEEEEEEEEQATLKFLPLATSLRVLIGLQGRP